MRQAFLAAEPVRILAFRAINGTFFRMSPTSVSPLPKMARAKALKSVVGPMEPAFLELERFLSAQVDAFEPEVQPFVAYCLSHSGKKLRPILVFSMGLESPAVPGKDIIKAAAIVELVHLATLVHDDILDDADMRHRTETVFARHGAHTAVLLGDALFAHALHLSADFPEVEVCRVVSRATRQVCSGEIAQTFTRANEVPQIQDYFRMIDLKTAELFAVSAYLGAYLAGFPAPMRQSACDFARYLGIAYQVYDDAADIFGREAQAGKTLGTDLATGKFTLPVLLWLERLPAKNRQEAVWRLRKDAAYRDDLAKVLRETGILTATETVFLDKIGLARDAARKIEPLERRQGLFKLCEFVASAWNKFTIS